MVISWLVSSAIRGGLSTQAGGTGDQIKDIQVLTGFILWQSLWYQVYF